MIHTVAHKKGKLLKKKKTLETKKAVKNKADKQQERRQGARQEQP